MDAQLVLETMLFQEFWQELQSMGAFIGQKKLKEAIRVGVFPFAYLVPMERDEYIIWRKGFKEWVAEHSVMKTPI